SIKEDVRWLGFDWADREYYASDYFDQLYEWAVRLIEKGRAYVCDLSPEEIPLDFHPFFRDLILWVNSTVHFLEKTAFYDGFYKAFGFGAYPCIYCEHQHCVAEEQEGVVDESIRRLCRHPDRVRPSMEAAGMDVFATAQNCGWHLSTIPCKDMEYGKIVHGKITSIGLVLLE
ncbi:MAG: DUF2284 domain-containing protein, partial [Methanomicrobiaceae archaeon]|nr:DUF2284 domain-containing protein [Methanomicrobiaceae archaeon]